MFLLSALWSNYNRSSFRADIYAGLITAIMLIPQAMAYSLLAGLRPIQTLYACLLPLVAYAVVGNSKYLAIGPVALLSMMNFGIVSQYARVGSAEFAEMSVLLAFMVGVCKLMFWLFRAGFIADWLSHAVISGFVSAAALLIAISQLEHLLGLQMERNSNVFVLLYKVVLQLPQMNGAVLGLACCSCVVLLLCKKYRPRFPRALMVVVGGGFIFWLLGLQRYGVSSVGEIPSGLPTLWIPHFSFVKIQQLLPGAVAIALVGYIESLSLGKSFAARNQEQIDPNREWLGLGVANLVAACSGAMVVAAGFSRSAVQTDAQPKTRAVGLYTAFFVALVLTCLSSVIAIVPKASLASLVFVASLRLIDITGFRNLWKSSKNDAYIFVVSFVGVLAFGIELGIALGILSNLSRRYWQR